eukprot:51176_1
MAHKAYNKLQFTPSVPKFLQNAMDKHGVKKNAFLSKKFVAEDGDTDDASTDKVETNSLEKKPERLEDGDRKDTDFEKPIVMNVEQITDLNTKQREQLNDIMRESQINVVKNANDTTQDEGNGDEDLSIAKQVMAFASVPAQNVIGMPTKRKPKFKFTKRKLTNDQSNARSSKRKSMKHDQNTDEPPAKKRKIYQEMTTKQLIKRRKKKLKFKTSAHSTNHEMESMQTQNHSMLSFDPDEDY